MKLLFIMRHSGYVRNFESTLRLLCDRGHDVHLAFQGRTKYAALDPEDIAAQLAAEYPRLTHGRVPMRSDGWGQLARELRLGADVLRYLGPEYDEAPALRDRALRAAPPGVLAQSARAPWNTGPGRRAYIAWQRLLDAAIAPDPKIDAFLRERAPDVLAVTPLVDPGAPQSEYLRSARSLGIRTAYCVASWDNLTNKGLIHGPVDLVTVWNEAMKREAVQMHGVPARAVTVTGAAAFDHWFGWRPSRTREAFCAEVGLPAGEPYLLYLCSSKFVGPREARFVHQWLEALRGAGGRLRTAGVLVRPHPQNAEQWRGEQWQRDLNAVGPVVVWPAGEAPVDTRTRNDYFDSIYHSAAVIGLNTTAEIESAIVGRPVYTVLADDYRGTQDGTLHFRHLREAHGGVVHVAATMTDHMAQLETALAAPADETRLRRFVEGFVRPHGLATPATPRMVDALERLAAQPARASRDALWSGYLRRRLAPRASAFAAGAGPDLTQLASGKGKRGAMQAAMRASRDAGTATADSEETMDATASGEKDRPAPTKGESRVRQRRVAEMIERFKGMGGKDRRLVLLSILDEIPADCFLDVIAANRPGKLDYDAADIVMRVTTAAEAFRVRACAKEPFTIHWLHERIGGGDVLYDIGANVGAYSLVAAKKPGAGARVYAFEASYANVGALTTNVALNRADEQITVLPVALSDTTSLGVFHLRDLQAGGARHALGHGMEDATVKQAVMTYRLDDLVEQLGLPLPDHIKLDVDGGELAVITGAQRTLAHPGLRTLLIEVATELSDAVTDAIERSGLRLETRIRKKNKAGEFAVWYGVFARNGVPGATVQTIDYADPVGA
jgi:FkbM family methyltransferase